MGYEPKSWPFLLKKRLIEQSEKGTSNPIFIVFEKERIYGIDPDYHTDGYMWGWQTDSESFFTDDEFSGEFGLDPEEITKENCPEEIEYEYFCKIYYMERNKFVCAHMTEAAAIEYIERNQHNMTDPHIYVTSMDRCPEMIAIREFFMGQL